MIWSPNHYSLIWLDLKIGWRPPDLILIWTWNSWLKACLTWWYKIVCLEWLTMIWSDLKVIFSISTWFDLIDLSFTLSDLTWLDLTFFSKSKDLTWLDLGNFSEVLTWFDLTWFFLRNVWFDLIWVQANPEQPPMVPSLT